MFTMHPARNPHLSCFQVVLFASFNGGAIALSNTVTTVFSNTFFLNLAGNTGGGLSITGGSPTVERNLFFGMNRAANGGGIAINGGLALIQHNTLISNTADTLGGGIHIAGSATPTLHSNLLIHNQSGLYGAGLAISESSGTIRNNTIVDSSPLIEGGTGGDGIYILGSASAPTIVNNIIVSNTYGIRGPNIAAPFPTIETNDVWNNSSGNMAGTNIQDQEGQNGNFSSDPLFVSGPRGPYYLSQTAAGQEQTSPAVNAGTGLAADLGLSAYTTRSDGIGDEETVDLGFHRCLPLGAEAHRLETPTGHPEEAPRLSGLSPRLTPANLRATIQDMKIIAQVKLQPTPEQADALKRTLETANAACNEISRVAWEQQVFGKYDLQQLVYQRIKTEYGLSAQMVIRCLAKVGDSYKLDRKTQRAYRPHGSIAYDDRILSFNLQRQTVSMWTVADEHRQTIPFVCGERQRQLLLARQGESDLVFRNGQFYLLVTCTVDEPTPDDGDAVLGVDLGITNIATDSDGEQYSGAQVERVRQRYQRRRDALQSVGTKSAKRRLKKISGKQRRFQSNTNHTIAKQLVRKAKGSARGIALEDLTHIRQRTTVRKSARAKHSNWSFNQLRQYISYKAQLCGVRVLLVDPRYTSQACNRCGTVDKRNRPDQATFCCVGCGHTNLADVNAACNIRDRASVSWPMASNLRVQAQAHLL